jgi:CII-binding regulator of phage lambda lysogenization HflD
LSLDPELPQINQWMSELLANELNVKNVHEKADLDETSTVKVYSTDEGKLKIGLDTELTESLKQEGALRELTRFVQAERKDSKLKLTDKIKLSLETESKFVKDMVSAFENELKEGTNSNEVVFEDVSEGVDVKIEGETLKFKVSV